MRGKWLILLVSLLGAPAWAQGDPPTIYRLDGREDLARRVMVELEVRPATQPGSVEIVRRVSNEDGSAGETLTGVGQRMGDMLRVRFPLNRGVADVVHGGVRPARPILGIYRFTQGTVRGLLSARDPVLGWSRCLEVGEILPTAPELTTFRPAGSLPFKRVVLCLDGIPYRVLKELRDQGRFAQFQEPARLLTVYPSLSSIAWSTILGLAPEPGYQAVFYSNLREQAMGVTLRKTKGSRFQTRMHHRHEGLVGHGLVYVLPFQVGSRQLRHMIRDLIDHQGSRTAYLYAYQTDPIAHMDGPQKLADALKVVDEELQALADEFQQRHGEPLEIVVVSDHGHTLQKGELVDLTDYLGDHGWEVTKKARQPKQCSFSTAGILASISLHCQEAGEPELAGLVAAMEGVDLCTYDVGGLQQFVISTRGSARFDYDPEQDAYGYTVVDGVDPLGYAAVYEQLRTAGKLDGRDYATGADLFVATAASEYPDAAHRIRVGHNTLVRNPGNVLASLLPGYENGSGMVKAAAAFRGRNGTHGALAWRSTAGILMTNYMAPGPAVRAEDFGRYVDLEDYAANAPKLELAAIPEIGANEAGHRLALELRDDFLPPDDKSGFQTTLRVTVKRARALLRDQPVWDGTFDGAALSHVRRVWHVPLEDAFDLLEADKTYGFRIRLEHRDASGALVHEEEQKVKARYRGAAQIFD